MALREIFIMSKGTKVILAITFSVSVAAVAFAFFYYRSINNSEDPRIARAREYLLEYDRISGTINSFEAFPLLDSANAIFRSIPDYQSSFEPGLIYNNKCSGLLMMAMYDSTLTEPQKSSLLSLSMKYCDTSIMVYRKWIDLWGALSSEEIAARTASEISIDDPAFRGKDFEKILSRRIENLKDARIETPRRLSVSLSNKGTIYRHMLKPDSSLICFREALSLWNDNRIANSNLNVLMGREPVKPTLIESLFPPDKKIK